MIIPRTIRRMQDRRHHKEGPWAELFEPYKGDEVISLDCETTSLDVSKAEILSIGAVRIKGKKVMTSDRLELHLKPPASLSEESIKVHKLRVQDLSNGLELEDAFEQLLQDSLPPSAVGVTK